MSNVRMVVEEKDRIETSLDRVSPRSATRRRARLLARRVGERVKLVGEAILKVEQEIGASHFRRAGDRGDVAREAIAGLARFFEGSRAAISDDLKLVLASLEPNDAALRRIERAMAGIERAATLTGQLAAITRSGRLAPTALTLGHVVTEILDRLAPTISATVDVRVTEAPGLWPALAGAAQFESALINLIANALDAMPAGGELTIEMSNAAAPGDIATIGAKPASGDFVLISIEDNGCGMPASVLANVFCPFFTTKRHGEAFGLGLALVRSFTTQSGGDVTVDSHPGLGTTVRLRLPRANAATRVPLAPEFSRASDGVKLRVV